ncbi:MAG: glycosyltransferase family 39 protein, partial [Aggregatilineales bacterium]
PDAQIPPLYSYVLAAIYALFGRGYMQVGILNTLMDVFSILFLVDICRRLFTQGTLWKQSTGVWVGLLAGLCYALYPYLIFQNLTVIDTPLWILFLHAFTWFMIRIREGETFTRQTGLFIIGGGLILGLSILARPIIPFFAVFVALWFLFRRSLWQTLLRLIPVALIGVMVVVPWIVRNYTIFDAFVPMTTTSGANLWQGNSKWVIPVFRAGYDVQWTAPENLIAPRYSREADSERFQLAVQFWRENPDKIPELLWVKFLIHWHYQITPLYNPQPGESFALDDDGNFFIARGETVTGVTASNVTYSDGSLLDTIGRPVHALYFGGLLLLATIGIFVSLRYWRDVSILYFVQISMTITYMIFHPSTRYRAPSDPLLFAL